MMVNIKKARRRSKSYHLQDSLGSENPNFEDITKLILQTIYNRPLREKNSHRLMRCYASDCPKRAKKEKEV